MSPRPEPALFRNPFYLLSASTRDTEEALQDRLDRALGAGLDEHLAHAALEELLVPRKRLAAELRWFPGIEPTTVQHAVHALTRDDLQEVSRIARGLEGVAGVN